MPRDINAPRPGPCSQSHEQIAAGDQKRIAGVYIPLDWTTRAAPPDCADWCRRSREGLTRVETSRWQRLLRPEPWRAGNKMWRYSECAVCTVTTSNPSELYTNPQHFFLRSGENRDRYSWEMEDPILVAMSTSDTTERPCAEESSGSNTLKHLK